MISIYPGHRELEKEVGHVHADPNSSHRLRYHYKQDPWQIGGIRGAYKPLIWPISLSEGRDGGMDEDYRYVLRAFITRSP